MPETRCGRTTARAGATGGQGGGASSDLDEERFEVLFELWERERHVGAATRVAGEPAPHGRSPDRGPRA